MADDSLTDNVRSDFPQGIDHIVEVAFSSNIGSDVAMLKQGRIHSNLCYTKRSGTNTFLVIGIFQYHCAFLRK